MSCFKYSQYKECDKITQKFTIIEKLNGVTVRVGDMTLITETTGYTKNYNYAPVNLEGNIVLDDSGNVITGLKPKKGFELVGYDKNSLHNTFTIYVESCEKREINVKDAFGARLKTYTNTETIVPTRVKAKHTLPIGTKETPADVLTYLQTLPGLSSIKASDVSDIEFHDVLGGREGSAVVAEVISSTAPDTSVLLNCNLHIGDLYDMTHYDLTNKEDKFCLDGMTGEKTHITNYTIAKKVTTP